MNPEQIKQEQERVKALLDKTAPEPWEIGNFRRYAVFSLHPDASRRPVVTVRHFEGDNEPMDGEAQANLQLCAAAPSLARAHLALLDAHLALHAQLAQAEGREAIRVEQLRRIESVKRFAAEQAARGIGQGYHDIATALEIALRIPLHHPETGAALSVEESLALAQAGEG